MTDRELHRTARRLYADHTAASLPLLKDVMSVLAQPEVDPQTATTAARLSRFFLFTPLAADVIVEAIRLLSTPGLASDSYAALLRVLRYAISWRAATELCMPSTARANDVAFNQVVALVGRPHLAAHTAFLTKYIVEPLVLEDASRLALVPSSPETRYWRHWLGERNSPAPLQEAVRTRLGTGRVRALVVHNIDDGQGDELVRCAPLLQGLVDLQPSLHVTVVTRRPYLYDHPRIATAPIADHDTVAVLLRDRFEIVVDFFEPVVAVANYWPELEPLVQRHVRRRRPFLFVSAVKGYNHFTYQRVIVDGRDFAALLGLDEARTGHTYEPTLRLLAELGLPARIGEQQPGSPCVLTGHPFPDADDEWQRLTSGCTRPVAMFSPFGGRGAMKGYIPDRFRALAEEVAALVDEGFAVMLLPNGLPWGTAARAMEVVALVAPEHRAHVIVAPDPARGRDPDRTMRMFKYFLRKAALAVTVEGWMAHMAHLQGLPYRLLMLPYSHAFHWHPYPRGPRQGVTLPRASEDPASTAPSYPRKDQWLLVLEGLRHEEAAVAVPMLCFAMKSLDRDVRAAAATALAAHIADERSASTLQEALKDRSWQVRRAAAAGLLHSQLNLGTQLGADYQRVLLCHCWIADGEWKRVIGAGRTALYPVCVAMDDEDDVTRREASWAFQQLAPGLTLGRS
jgi:ADP-heptose:LPS heptosyltransferase